LFFIFIFKGNTTCLLHCSDLNLRRKKKKNNETHRLDVSSHETPPFLLFFRFHNSLIVLTQSCVKPESRPAPNRSSSGAPPQRKTMTKNAKKSQLSRSSRASASAKAPKRASNE
jgi:hypothetical protein